MPAARNAKEKFKESVFPNPVTKCWMWMACTNRRNYGIMGIVSAPWLAHRYSYERFVGPIPDGLEVLHNCDNPSCVNPDHLRVGTQTENMRDMDMRGRRVNTPQRGERHGCSKLTADNVNSIRLRHSSPKDTATLALEFGVSTSAVRRIISGKNWKHRDVPR